MFMSKQYDFQKWLFREIVFDEEFKIKQTPGHISDDHDSNSGKI